MSNRYYARYIPPKLPKPSSHHSPDPKPSQPPLPSRSAPDNALLGEAKSSLPSSFKPRTSREKRKRTDVSTQETRLHKRQKVKSKKTESIEPISEDHKVSKQHQKILAKFERSSRVAATIRHTKVSEQDDTPPGGALDEPSELHDLAPLPQPQQKPEEEFIPTFSALPSWISEPIVIPRTISSPFEDLGISKKILANLKASGHKNAFAVQAGLIDLLTPGPNHYRGDLCVSAPTGSGKTLAYLVPIIEALQYRLAPKLRAVIIVPTRELVFQVRKVAALCSRGTGLKIGSSVGSVPLAVEQNILIRKEIENDRTVAQDLMRKAKTQLLTCSIDDDPLWEDIRTLPPCRRCPDVDILICTPGRLIERVQRTIGFSLADVDTLVLDEADRLLEKGLEEWVDVVLGALPKRQQPNQIRKIILSATMTKDVAKLALLDLEKPALVAVQGQPERESQITPSEQTVNSSIELPSDLTETAIPVHDGAEKPLFLLLLLLRLHTTTESSIKSQKSAFRRSKHKRTCSDLSSDGSDESMSTSSSQNISSDSDDSKSDPDSDTDSEEDLGNGSQAFQSSKFSNTPVPGLTASSKSAGLPLILIFTNSNEDSARLQHLISVLHPPFANQIGTLTKISKGRGLKTLASFKRRSKNILIASDRASRGLDVPDLAHIISYDIPRSLTSYIHRVGRTARAGMAGSAWTLFTKTEAGWFWNEVARSKAIRRDRPVQRLTLGLGDLDTSVRDQYEPALKDLQSSVQSALRKKPSRHSGM